MCDRWENRDNEYIQLFREIWLCREEREYVIAEETTGEDFSFLMREVWTCSNIACNGPVERKLEI